MRHLLCCFCAARFAECWCGIPNHPYEQGFDLRLWPARLEQPLRWKKPRMIFVNSMSDLFHKRIPHAFIDQVFDTMERADWHIYQVLTKRSSLMRGYIARRYGSRPVPRHIWLGVSVEDAPRAKRIAHLRASTHAGHPRACAVRLLRATAGADGRLEPAGHRLGDCRG